MGQRYQLPDGRVVEALPQGGYQVVGGPSAMTSSDPTKPLAVRQKMIDVQRGQADLQLTPYQLRKQRAEAQSAEIKAREDKEQYDAQHPKASTTGLYGPDYLKTISASDQAMVKALDEGRLAFPQGAALRSPFWQEKLSQVAQYDPTFDATNFNARAQARSNAIKGKLGQSNNALNTAIGHLGTLYDQIDGTASHGGFPFATTVNSVENWYAKGHGDPGITNFTDTGSKLADELESVYRNGGGAEQGVVRQLRNLDPNMSREQKVGIVRNAVELLTSKLAANLAQYNFGTGGKPTWDMLDKDAKATLDRIAPGAVDKYFAAPAAIPGPGNNQPPPQGPTGGNINPNSLAPAGGGSQDKPDPFSASFWESSARAGTPYRQALAQWQAETKARGLTTVTPPPPGQYGKVVSYMQANPNREYHPFSGVIRTSTDIGNNIANDIVSNPAGAFGTHYYDSLLANIPSALAGPDQAAYFNAVTRGNAPKSSMFGDILGVVGGATGAGKAVNAGVDALKANPLMARYFRATGMVPQMGLTGEEAKLADISSAFRRGMTGDTVYAGTSGAAQNPDNPAAGAAEGMAAMGAGNVVGHTVLGPTIKAIGDTRAGQAIVNAIPGVNSFTPPAALDSGQSIYVTNAKRALDFRNKLQQAADLGLPYAPADADPRLRLIAGAATRKSPDVRALAENTLIPRQAGQAERAIGQINTNLAPVGDLGQLKTAQIDAARTAAAPLYDQAYQLPGRTSPELDALLSTPAGKQAMARARTIAANERRDPTALGFDLNDQGETVLTRHPSAQTIDYVKRGLDDMLESYRDPMSGKLNLDEAGRAINDVRANLLKQADTLYPEYGKARQAYQALASTATDAQRGYDATSPKVTPETVASTINVTRPENVPFFQKGFAASMADAAERARLNSDPYSAINGSMGQQAKLSTVFPQGAPDFMRAQSLEGDMSKTAQETLGGSPTAGRMQADRLFESPFTDAATDIGTTMLTGGIPSPLSLARLATKLSDARALGIKGAQQKADAVGPILLNTDPRAALAQFDLLQKMYLARKAYSAQTGALGSAIAAPTIYGATQQ